MARFKDTEKVHFPDDAVKFPYGEPGGPATADMTVVRSSLNEYGTPVVMVLDATNSLSTFWESDLKIGKRAVAPGRVFKQRPVDEINGDRGVV